MIPKNYEALAERSMAQPERFANMPAALLGARQGFAYEGHGNGMLTINLPHAPSPSDRNRCLEDFVDSLMIMGLTGEFNIPLGATVTNEHLFALEAQVHWMAKSPRVISKMREPDYGLFTFKLSARQGIGQIKIHALEFDRGIDLSDSPWKDGDFRNEILKGYGRSLQLYDQQQPSSPGTGTGK
jgi:hypothetical protein